MKLLLKNQDNDNLDYYQTIPNGLCSLDSLYRLSQFADSGVEPPKTNYADSKSHKQFLIFIDSLSQENQDEVNGDNNFFSQNMHVATLPIHLKIQS